MLDLELLQQPQHRLLFLLVAKDRVNSTSAQFNKLPLIKTEVLCRKQVLVAKRALEDADIIRLYRT